MAVTAQITEHLPQTADAARSGGDLVFLVPLKGCEVSVQNGKMDELVKWTFWQNGQKIKIIDESINLSKTTSQQEQQNIPSKQLESTNKLTEPPSPKKNL